MRLKKLEITGFKSFLEKAKIIFPPGISAVVGPNGCGKSNIVDALRWVMGEQSIKQLRGKAKEDIIFAGAAGKQKVNLAEVSLLVENTLESAIEPLNQYTEIMITRRLYRSGESAYLINRQPCRLKDIHDLFLGSGTGKNSFAVIQQGNIGAITDASPEERRYFIEEAAEITKYKTRKKETLSKIKSVKENLLRITDITAEIKRQINALNRQAKKATKYKEYRKRIKYLDIRIAVWKFDGITEKINTLDRALQDFKTDHAEEIKTIAILEGEQAELKSIILRKKYRVKDLKDRQYETHRLVDKYQNDIEHYKKNSEQLGLEILENKKTCSELKTRNRELSLEIEQVENNNLDVSSQIITDEKSLENNSREYETIKTKVTVYEEKLKLLNARHMTLAGDHAKYKNMLGNSQKREEDIVRRIKIIDEEEYSSQKKQIALMNEKATILKQQQENEGFTEDAEQQLEVVSQKLIEKKQSLTKHFDLLKDLEIEKSRITSEHKTLKKMNDSYEWYKDGVKAVMESPFNDNVSVLDLLADVISPEPGFEKAVEIALGDLLQSVIVDTIDTGIELTRFLSDTKSGRTSFIPFDIFESTRAQEQNCDNSYLIKHLSFPVEYENIIKSLMNDVVIAESFEDVADIKKRAGRPCTIVTKTGEMLSKRNIVTGGENTTQVSILEKKNELRALQEDININACRIAQETEIEQSLETEISAYIEEEKEYLEELEEIKAEKNEIEKKRYVVEADITQNERRLKISILEQDQLSGEQIDIEAEIKTASKKIAEISNEIETTGLELEKNISEHKVFLARIETFSKRIVDIRLKITSLKAQSENYHNSIDRLKSFLNEGRERYSHFEEDIKVKSETIETTESLLKKCSDELSSTSARLAEIATEVETAESDYNKLEEELSRKEENIERSRKTNETTLDQIREKQVKLTELQMQREVLTNRIEEKYHHKINQYQLEFEEKEACDDKLTEFDITILETELNDLKLKIKRMGDVNLGAISEFEELKTRYDFMLKQHDDLTASLDDLEKIIDKINSVSQERFINTFNAINEKLSELFSRLFEGGTAAMVLTEPSKPLETGVELMIKPPGKTLTRLSLLSGGEKALSAIAFVFSVFLIKPASFCIMDEIDAPLDDSNVVRFNNLVKLIGEQSQILIITHNKLTMEFADILFGVTMEKKGISKIVSVNLTKSGVVDTDSVEVA